MRYRERLCGGRDIASRIDDEELRVRAVASSSALKGRHMPDRLSRVALGWFGLTTIVFWLPTVRGAFDGPSYQWGLIGFSGRGLGGDYWFPLLGTSIALIVLAGGWRCRPWACALVAAWSALLLLGITAVVVNSPDDFRLRGDTLGIDVSLAAVGPTVFGAAAVLSAVSAWRVHRRRQHIEVSWQRRNWRWLGALAGALPLQFALLRFGTPNSLSDQVAVVITIIQWLLVGQVFRIYTVAQVDERVRQIGATLVVPFGPSKE